MIIWMLKPTLNRTPSQSWLDANRHVRDCIARSSDGCRYSYRVSGGDPALQIANRTPIPFTLERVS